MDLFEHKARSSGSGQPLAERMRPTTLEHFFGQDHLVGSGKLLEQAIARPVQDASGWDLQARLDYLRTRPPVDERSS